LKSETERLTTSLKNAPDSNELTELKVRSEELEKHNETLKKDLENLQNLYNNYMLQVQSLINQKAIEAPGAKKRWWQFW
jgi:molecular chaperone GrpE (heat shock protein)